jgi:hypothetical protein
MADHYFLFCPIAGALRIEGLPRMEHGQSFIGVGQSMHEVPKSCGRQNEPQLFSFSEPEPHIKMMRLMVLRNTVFNKKKDNANLVNMGQIKE